jgi:hypothetical protein
MARGLATLILVGTMAGAAATAAPAEPGKRRAPSHPLTFSGSCQFSGMVRFVPSLTNSPQPASNFAEALGRCSGTLVDRRGRSHTLDDEPVGYAASDHGDAVSCGGGVSTGDGYLRFKLGRLRFGLEESRATGVAALSLTGAAGGSAGGEARISGDEDPVAIATACAGAGLEGARVDIDVATTSPLSG